MKRKFKIIIIIILIITAFILGAWMLARNKAVKNSVPPPTFKEFLGIGITNKSQTDTDVDNTLSSDFVNPPEETVDSSSDVSQTIPVGTSVFTNTGLGLGLGINNGGLGLGIGNTGLDLGGGNNGGSGSGGTGSGNSGGGSSTGGGGGSVIIPPPNPVLVQPECSAADLTINFTPEEINRLNVLKTRFFVIAETLNTDTDVNTEISNYDTFKAKSKKIAELYDYCKNSIVYVNAQATVVGSQRPGTVVPGTNGDINYRVPTPFWHDFAKDNQALVHQGSNWMGIFSDPDLIFPERSIEHALRLNLW